MDAELRRRYAEPARHYHTAQHLADCLGLFDEVAGSVADPVAVELALWFHDAVYDPRATDNEERSAELATATLRAGSAAESLVAGVAALIATTQRHEPAGVPDAEWLLDLDLAVLARPRADFLRYEAAIRAEYAWVPLDAYCAGRARILERFLDRPALYLTGHFRPRCEVPARENLAFSLAMLRAGRLPVG